MLMQEKKKTKVDTPKLEKEPAVSSPIRPINQTGEIKQIPVTATSPSLTPPGVTQDKEHQVLADFFNSLINKDRPTPAAIAGSGKKDMKELKDLKDLKIPSRNPTNNVASREDVAKQLDRIRNKYQSS